MPRAIGLVALTIALALGGCLRNKYDLCGEVSPHPECDAGATPRDAGTDSGLDPAADDAGSEDSGPGASDDGGAGGDGAGDAGADAGLEAAD